MKKKNRHLVAHVDAETYSRFTALADRLGDGSSALLRKLVIRAIMDDADGLLDPGPIGNRKRSTKNLTG